MALGGNELQCVSEKKYISGFHTHKHTLRRHQGFIPFVWSSFTQFIVQFGLYLSIFYYYTQIFVTNPLFRVLFYSTFTTGAN